MRRLCLVTGASSGIGEAFARLLASQGCDLVLIARRADRLNTLAEELRLRHGGEAYSLAADLSRPEAVEEVLAFVASLGRSVDVLVNNAGAGMTESYSATEWRSQSGYLQLMVNSVCHLAHAVLPSMLAQRYGRIINVSSVSALMPGVGGTTLYAGSKSLLVAFSENLYLETLDSGVHVTALCPGLTRSEFHEVIKIRERLEKTTHEWMWMTAAEVAEAGLRAVEAGRPLCVPGLWNKIFVTWYRLIGRNAPVAKVARLRRAARRRAVQGGN